MFAGRYVRARRTEGFISVIAWFSFLGIMLGVTALIVILSIQNGLRAEFLKNILGFNGHITVISATDNLRDYAAITERLKQADGVVSVTPMVDGQILAVSIADLNNDVLPDIAASGDEVFVLFQKQGNPGRFHDPVRIQGTKP